MSNIEPSLCELQLSPDAKVVIRVSFQQPRNNVLKYAHSKQNVSKYHVREQFAEGNNNKRINKGSFIIRQFFFYWFICSLISLIRDNCDQLTFAPQKITDGRNHSFIPHSTDILLLYGRENKARDRKENGTAFKQGFDCFIQQKTKNTYIKNQTLSRKHSAVIDYCE